MSMCPNCRYMIQEAAKCNIMEKKGKLIKKFGEDSPEAKVKLQTDPFVLMWVPAPPETNKPRVVYKPLHPNFLEFDYTVCMDSGPAAVQQRLYPFQC